MDEYDLHGSLFEWDDPKAASNVAKHGVSFEEAASALADPLALFADDPDHSDQEDRELAFGTSDRNRILFVSFTRRNGRRRIISARKASTHERRDYDEALGR